MKAHGQGITNLQFLSNQNILITGGKDNKLRVKEYCEGNKLNEPLVL